MDGIDRASSVLPAPGGPIIKMMCSLATVPATAHVVNLAARIAAGFGLGQCANCDYIVALIMVILRLFLSDIPVDRVNADMISAMR